VFVVKRRIRIRGDPVDVLVRLQGSDPRARVRRFRSLRRLIGSLRWRELLRCRRCAREMGEEAWHIIWRGRKFVVLPDHVHVRRTDARHAPTEVEHLERALVL